MKKLAAVLLILFASVAQADYEFSPMIGDEVAVIDFMSDVADGVSVGARYVADYNTSSTDSSYIIRDQYFGPVAKLELEVSKLRPYISGSVLWDLGDDMVLTGGAGVGIELTEDITVRAGHMWSDDDVIDDMWLFGLAIKI